MDTVQHTVPAHPGWWELHHPSTALPRGVRMTGITSRSASPWTVHVAPCPSIGVLVDCTTGPVRTAGSAGLAGAVVVGTLPAPTAVSGDGTEVLELDIDPIAAAGLLGVAPAELGGPVVDLGDVWGSSAADLRERLVATASWQERFALVGAALAARAEPRPRVDPEVADAWHLIAVRHGRVRVTALADRYGWSRTRFWRRFTDQTGVTPKRAAMLARFRRALHDLEAGLDLARVAAECGYADQAHMSREFRSFSGRSPSEIAGDPLWQFRIAATAA
ncbi:AraC family transcriptional regulator [Isoptericola variabilis]|uniref:Transcriptional regulator, AraC family n=1 Tax=Isoptericola variabilis (strain 225) TaxID=743718 RepID=F6FRP7_ISOV2|nr:AraC family transcriptional regulator [Isoptericola variabilis]AEG42988.1 transcriptional regulator, AraC family [Isoptericola variabilis 225]TWH30040.1 AraC-like DNA-binding protein [Isoptericola variabilis J7]